MRCSLRCRAATYGTVSHRTPRRTGSERRLRLSPDVGKGSGEGGGDEGGSDGRYDSGGNGGRSDSGEGGGGDCGGGEGGGRTAVARVATAMAAAVRAAAVRAAAQPKMPARKKNCTPVAVPPFPIGKGWGSRRWYTTSSCSQVT